MTTYYKKVVVEICKWAAAIFFFFPFPSLVNDEGFGTTLFHDKRGRGIIVEFRISYTYIHSKIAKEYVQYLYV